MAGPVVDFGWTMSELAPVLIENGIIIQILFIHRHPIDVAGSFTNIGNYSIYNSPDWAISPCLSSVKFSNEYKEKWSTMFPFEKNLYLWLEKIAYALEVKEKFPNIKFMGVNSLELFTDESVLKKIANFLGFDAEKLKISSYHNDQQLWARESRPVGMEWIRYKEYKELLVYAKKLGYDMDEAYVKNRIKKYMLPKRITSYIRNKSKYWQIKSWVGNKLVLLKLRNRKFRHPSNVIRLR